MKMAEKAVLLTFQNNCESINSNCVEVANDEANEKTTSNDNETISDKQADEPQIIDNVAIPTQEDAVEDILAGENAKNAEFQVDDDDLLISHIDDNDEDAIDFKNDNNLILDCQDMEKLQFSDDNDLVEEEDEEEEPIVQEPETKTKDTTAQQEEEEEEMQIVDNNESAVQVEEREKESLTKMQMDGDVREGCNIQPSSPGHADEQCTAKETNGLSKNEEAKGENGIKSNDTEEINHTSEENSNNSLEETSSQSNKRKLAKDNENNIKRLRLEIEENYMTRDRILNEFIEMSDCNNLEQIQQQTEQILAEIKTLNDLAKAKEKEWNNIIHLKKMKEELLLRMQRRKQIMLINNDNTEKNGESDHRTNQSILKTNLNNKNMKMKNRSILPKYDLNGDLKQNKQRPIIDVQSIIADYRQRHPENVPRRGRRIRHQDPAKSVLNFSSLALGSGSQMQQNIDLNNELGLLLNAMEGANSRPEGESSTFRDMLIQFAKLSQSERNELFQNALKPPPPPYPEVTVHPVPTTTTVAPTNSLLHGILTKNPGKSSSKTTFSPTLARLLTAPEKAAGNVATSAANVANPNMSISEILSTSKARNEITITPVGAQFEAAKGKTRVMEEEETEDSADRLVIDESTETTDGRSRDNSDDTTDEVPQCQGCNQKSALFVCAGCGNQWYCSRDCQVSAWDEHSEVCSG